MTDRFCVLGSVEDHVAKLHELAEAGVDQFNLYLMNGDEEAQLEAYGRDVIPASAPLIAARCRSGPTAGRRSSPIGRSASLSTDARRRGRRRTISDTPTCLASPSR